ncbi:MAG: hypothetical protein ACXWUG_10675 [Polyangiales bacterium]
MRLAALALGAFLVGCGGTVIGDDSFDGAVDGSVDGADDTHVAHDTLRDGVVLLDTGTMDTEPEVYVDPGCPDAPAPKPDYKCDPLATPPGGCKPGQACFPYVVYPTEPCEHETYHAACFPAGSGKSGDPCSTTACAAGYACVVSGAGNVCVKMCVPGKTGACPDGLVCEPTDVPGVGGCL